MEPESKFIELVNGGWTRVDAADYEWLNKHRWFRSSTGYAYRQGWHGPQRDSANHWTVYMHREVNQTPENLFTDHINGNKLDNRRANLRTVDKSRNSTNRPKAKVLAHPLSSKLKGVSLHRATGLWRARVRDGEYERTTYHKTPEQAALDYNRMAKERFGEFAQLNQLPTGLTPTEHRRKSSQFRGVSRRGDKWEASIWPGNKYVGLGLFESEREAAHAYNEAAVKYFGERAKLNVL